MFEKLDKEDEEVQKIFKNLVRDHFNLGDGFDQVKPAEAKKNLTASLERYSGKKVKAEKS